MDALRCLSYLIRTLCSHSDLICDCIPHENRSQLFTSGVSVLFPPFQTVNISELSAVPLTCNSVLTAGRLADMIGMAHISSLFISLQFFFHPMQSLALKCLGFDLCSPSLATTYNPFSSLDRALQRVAADQVRLLFITFTSCLILRGSF